MEILESQLSTYGKSVTEDKLREEAIRLMEEKELYQVGGVDNLIHYLLKQIGSWLSFGQLVGGYEGSTPSCIACA